MFLVFAGIDYYPSGGALDYVDKFVDKDEAIEYSKNLLHKSYITEKQDYYAYSIYWTNVLDTDTREIVFFSGESYGRVSDKIKKIVDRDYNEF